jgi:carbamate kinase
MSVPDQYQALGETSGHIARIIRDGWQVAIGHGNGPQVGFILRRSELAAHELHEVPLDVCDADTQGAIGYELQQNLGHDFRRLKIDRQAVTVVTQVEVDPTDPAFQHPTKPIGTFMDEAQARIREERDGWAVREDAGRGWRRVVASPRPIRIVEERAVKALLREDFVVITVGGGGIPVVTDPAGDLRGVAAVIDKDFASALLAITLRADIFMITTAVDQVALDFGRPEQRWLDTLTLADAKEHLATGTHFAAGSMAPKIEACIEFLEHGGGEAIITSPQQMEEALAGHAGTRIVR